MDKLNLRFFPGVVYSLSTSLCTFSVVADQAINAPSALARYPDQLTLDTAVEVPAAAVLFQEGA